MKNKKLFILVIFVLIIISILFFLNKTFKKRITVTINGSGFQTELTSSENQRRLGLSNRNELCRDCAMLFVFPEPGQYGFWMKDMNFNLDIIWINGNEIVYIEKNFSKDSFKVVRPKIDADKVLEINAGISDLRGFAVGDKVFIK